MTEIRFKRYKLTEPFKAWLLTLDKTVKITLTALLAKYKKDGALPNTATMLTGCDGVGEMRFMFGPGYRIYFCRYGDVVLLLLNGGDKDTQIDDVKTAQAIKDHAIETAKHQRRT